jgi:hypothetical protein
MHISPRRLSFVLSSGIVFGLGKKDGDRSFIGRRSGPTLLRFRDLQHVRHLSTMRRSVPLVNRVGTPVMERCVTPLLAEAQVPVTHPLFALGGIWDLTAYLVSEPQRTSFRRRAERRNRGSSATVLVGRCPVERRAKLVECWLIRSRVCIHATLDRLKLRDQFWVGDLGESLHFNAV